jgi:tetratricopeptide (TPR) repeat protein
MILYYANKRITLCKFNIIAMMLVTLIGLTACESALSREFNLLMNTRDYAKSEQLLLNKIQTNPDHAEANYLLGFLYIEQQQFEKAVDYFERSYKSFTYREHIDYLKERSFNIEYNKGVDLFEENELGNAIIHFRNATKLNPQDQEAYLMLGISQSIFGMIKDGIESFEACLKLNPNSFSCSWNLSKLYHSTQDYQNASTTILSYLKNDPNNVQLLWILVNNYLDSNFYQEAEQAFQQIREYFMISEILRQSVVVESNRLLTGGSAIDQSLIGYVKQIGFRFFELGEYNRAVPYLIESVNRLPTDIELRRTLNLAAFYVQDYVTLSQSGQKLLEMVPNDKSTQAQLIIAFEKTGDLDNLQILKSIIEGIH